MTARGAEGHTYAVEFSDGTVKIGYSANPERRIKQHAAMSATFGIHLVRQWISNPHLEAKANEQQTIAWCAERADGVRKREYFTGLQFASVAAYLSGLPATRLTDEAFANAELAVQAKAEVLISTIAGLGHVETQASVRVTGGVPTVVYGGDFPPLGEDLDPGDRDHVSAVAKMLGLDSDGARWVMSSDAPRKILYAFLQRFAEAYAAKDMPVRAGCISEFEWLVNPEYDAHSTELLMPILDAADDAGKQLVVIEGGA